MTNLEELVIMLKQSNERLSKALEESSKNISELQTLYEEAEKNANRLRERLNTLETLLDQAEQSSMNSQEALRTVHEKLVSAEKSLAHFSELSQKLERQVRILRIWAVAGPIIGFALAVLLL